MSGTGITLEELVEMRDMALKDAKAREEYQVDKLFDTDIPWDRKKGFTDIHVDNIEYPGSFDDIKDRADALGYKTDIMVLESYRVLIISWK